MQSSAADPTPWWQWPTVLSLDAPAVVVLWQVLIARSASVETRAPEMAVLGGSVWLAYAADRWIEGWRLTPANIRTRRHRFYQERRWPIAVAWIAVLCADIGVAFLQLGPAELGAGALVLVPAAAYIFSHQLIHRNTRRRPPKEACVAALLGAGAVVFTFGRPGANLSAMVLPLILFVLLCFSNCALISVWENDVDRAQGQTSLALQFAGAAAVSRTLPWLIALLAAAAWLAAPGGQGWPAASAVLSGILLGLVDASEGRIGRARARVLADVALMTPAIPLVLGSLR